MTGKVPASEQGGNVYFLFFLLLLPKTGLGRLVLRFLYHTQVYTHTHTHTNPVGLL
jgi:hypothetical protein